MSENSDKSSESSIPYPSAASLKEAHGQLIKRYNLHRQGNGDTDSNLWDDVEAFIKRGSLTGLMINDDSERWIAQSNLEFWAATLYREKYSKGGAPPSAVLLDFDPKLAPTLDNKDCPYLGLDAFRDAKFFFGRQRLLGSLLEKLEKRRLLSLIGESGSGKSSLVMGGLLPALKAGKLSNSQNWHYFKVMVPGSNPFLALRELIKSPDVAGQAESEIELTKFLQDTTYLSKLVKARFNKPVVLVIDQFEEIFTLCEDVKMRHAFIGSIFHLTQTPDLRHLVVFTMRSDYKSNVNDLPPSLGDFVAAFNDAQVPVTAPDPIELREAITKPAEMVGLKFEKEVVDALVQDIVTETAPLPLLQFTLLKLWEGRSHNLVTMETYKRLGRGRRALELSAEALYDKLSPAQQETLRRILLRMVKPTEGLEFTSNRVLYNSFFYKTETAERIKGVLDGLIKQRLVRLTESSAGDVQVEVAHEALVRYWPRLVKWLGDVRADMATRKRLEAKADEWINLGAGTAGLLDAVQVREAQRWLESAEATTIGFNPSLQQLVDASQKAIQLAENEKEAARQREAQQYQALAREQEQRALAESQRADAEQQRAIAEAQRAEDAARSGNRLRVMLYLAIAATVVTLLLAVFALRERGRANDQTKLANEQTRIAQSNQLAAQSLSYLRDQPDLSLLLSVQALSIDPTNAEARNSLIRGLEFSSNIKSFLSGHKFPISALAFRSSSDLVTVDQKGNLIYWDAEKHVRTGNVNAPAGLANASVVTTSPDGKALIMKIENEAKWFLWIPGNNSTLPQPLEVNSGKQAEFAFSTDSQTLAIVEDDKIYLSGVNDISKRVLIKGTPKSSDTYYSTPVFSPDGKTLAMTDKISANIYLLNLATGNREQLNSPEDSPVIVAFSPDGKFLVSGGFGGTIVLWELKGPHKNRELAWWKTESTSSISSLVFNPKFPRKVNSDPGFNDFATSNRQGNIITWRLSAPSSDGEPADILPLRVAAYAGGISTLAYSPDDGNVLVSGSPDSSVILWSVKPDRSDWFRQPLVSNGGSINSIAVSSDSKILAAGDRLGNVILWDLEQRSLLRKMTDKQPGVSDEQRHAVTSVALSVDGKTLASGNDDGQIALWDVPNNKKLKEFSAHSNIISSVALSPDSKTLASTGEDKKIFLWNVDTAEPIKEIPNPSGKIKSIAFSPDGKTLATGGEDTKVRLWNIDNGKEIVLPGHSDQIESVVFSPDGQTVASGGYDKTIILWDISSSPSVRRRLTGHTDVVSGLAYSKSGDILASGSWDGTVIVWNTATGQQAYKLTGQNPTADSGMRRSAAVSPNIKNNARNQYVYGCNWCIALTPDGKTLVASRSGTAVYLWDIRPETWLTRACKIANRNLNRDEWTKFMPFAGTYGRTCPNLPPGEGTP